MNPAAVGLERSRESPVGGQLGPAAEPATSKTTIHAPKRRLDTLTMLRFPAALWVLLFHLGGRATPVGLTSPVRNILSNGPFAMSLFFVLSGTVLAYGFPEIKPTRRDALMFYRARIAQLYPTYLVVHLAALWWFRPDVAGGAMKWIYVNLLSALGIQAWFPHTFSMGVNSGTWSLSVEFFFYALFPVLLPCIALLRRELGQRALCFYLCAFSGFFGFADYTLSSNVIYYIMPHVRLPEFALGLALGLQLRATDRRSRWSGAALLAAVAAAIGVAMTPIAHFGIWTRANLIVVPAMAWLIYSLVRFEQSCERWPTMTGWRKIPVYLGDCSYALFIGQLPPLLFLDSASGHAWKQAMIERHGVAAVWITLLIVCFAIAIVLHEAVQKPIRRVWLRQPVRVTEAMFPGGANSNP